MFCHNLMNINIHTLTANMVPGVTTITLYTVLVVFDSFPQLPQGNLGALAGTQIFDIVLVLQDE